MPFQSHLCPPSHFLIDSRNYLPSVGQHLHERGQALIITEPWGLNETRLSPTVYFPGHVHVAINVGGGWDKQSHCLNSGRQKCP